MLVRRSSLLIRLCITLVLILFAQPCLSVTQSHQPKLVVVLIIDQFAHAMLEKLSPFLRHGLKHLKKHGIYYEDAHHDHGMPATATGHTVLNVGTYANIHGIIGNQWINEQGKLVLADQDNRPEAAVIGPNNTYYNYGKSARNCMTTGLSDEFILSSQPFEPHSVCALSFKSRAATACAGHTKRAEAFWFDNATGNFTSSAAYMDVLPEWIDMFNKKHDIHKKKTIFWSRAYPHQPALYDFAHACDYRFAACNEPLVDCPVELKKRYGVVAKTPYGIRLLLDLALERIKIHCKTTHKGKLLLWVSISCPDKIGHIYGPDSLEAIDMIYHLDREIGRFMHKTAHKIHPRNTLYVLTADHGVAPIPELVREQGIPRARRISADRIMKKLNATIAKKWGVKKYIAGFQIPQFYVNHAETKKLNNIDHMNITSFIKKELLKIPGIRNAWTYDELAGACALDNPFDRALQKQLYPGRSGYITVLTDPYSEITNYSTGTSHRTPYEFNTHVPLIFYQHATHSHRRVPERVSTMQVPNSIAYLLGIPKPATSTSPLLPGLVNECQLLCY